MFCSGLTTLHFGFTLGRRVESRSESRFDAALRFSVAELLGLPPPFDALSFVENLVISGGLSRPCRA